MTTILIIAIAVNVLLFLLMVYTESKRAKKHRDRILEMKGAEEVHTTQMVRLNQQLRNAKEDLENLKVEYEAYKMNAENNALMKMINPQDYRDLQASYDRLAEEYSKLEKWYAKPNKRYLLRKIFKVFDVKSKEQLADVLNIKEIKL